jgi:hypothetical protein
MSQLLAEVGGFERVPVEALWALSKHYGLGAKKYARGNFIRGYSWSLSADALLRHLFLFASGQDLVPPAPEGEPPDPTAGACHLAPVMWHFITLWCFQTRKLGTDDRLLCAVNDAPNDLDEVRVEIVPDTYSDAVSEIYVDFNLWLSGGFGPDTLMAGFVRTADLYRKWKSEPRCRPAVTLE